MHRILTEQEMDLLLGSETFGHLACCQNDKPYIVPLAYLFHKNVFYGQTTEGQKIDCLRVNSNVCFQVQRQDQEKWRSVLSYGTFEELQLEKMEESESMEVARLLSDKLGSIQKNVGVSVQFFFGKHAAPLSVEGRRSVIFRIVISERSGREYTD